MAAVATVRVAVFLFVQLLCCVRLGSGLMECRGEACSSTACSAHVIVDLDSSTDCRGLGESLLNSTCNSLQDVLNGLRVVSGYTQDDCIAVSLSPGRHTLTGSVTMTKSVVITGSGGVARSAAQPSPSPSTSPDLDNVRRTSNYVLSRSTFYNYIYYRESSYIKI